jgi:NhaP-type Na+/H+ or K+/H+ antiporter
LAGNELMMIALILVLGIGAQWFAWRLRIPSILILLLIGFAIGPMTGILDPDLLLGDILFPFVSIAVALILFEGGLNLELAELKDAAKIVRNMVSIGVVVAWLLTAVAAYFILNFEYPVALLFGAVLVVTGPTVIMPLLRHIRAVGKISSITKWEGIVNDPIGAILAVLVFEAVLSSSLAESSLTVIISMLETLVIALLFGGGLAWMLIQLLKRYWIPDYLQNSFILMVVIAAFTLSNMLQKEAGLFSVTALGIILANQRSISVKHIIEFKENIGILLLSSLFIILAARLQIEDLQHLGWHSIAFLAALMFVIRPLTVLAATAGTGLNWREKVFLTWMAPRGIVAAAIIAIFAFELESQAGYDDARRMVPEIFFIIVGTVTIYGLSAAPLGRWLGIAQPDPQGVLLAGAHAWARDIAAALKKSGVQVLLVDTNRENLHRARLEGCSTFYASILSEYILDEIDIGGLGRLLALTSNDEVNSLACLHFTELFGREKVYQVAPKTAKSARRESVSKPLRGRFLFSKDSTYSEIERRYEAGYRCKTTKLTEQFSYRDFVNRYGGEVLLMFQVDENKKLRVFTPDNVLQPKAGDTLISFMAQTKSGNGD